MTEPPDYLDDLGRQAWHNLKAWSQEQDHYADDAFDGYLGIVCATLATYLKLALKAREQEALPKDMMQTLREYHVISRQALFEWGLISKNEIPFPDLDEDGIDIVVRNICSPPDRRD